MKDAYIIANTEIVLREESDDWAVLFDPNSGQVVGINPVGSFIWKLLDGKHSLDQIADAINRTFSDPPVNIPEEVRGFTESLIERGFAGKIIG